MLNKYPGTCGSCGGRVARHDGTLHRNGRRWTVTHVECSAASDYPEDSNPRNVSHVYRTSGGTFYQNKRGRCEDAPCCGCCTV